MGENFPKFQELVRIAIGPDRSQASFANEANLAPAQVSRFLNLTDIPRPSVSTLRKIANASNGRVSLERLMEACNYSNDQIMGSRESCNINAPVENELFTSDALKVIASFKKGVQEFSGHATRFNSIEDVLDTVEMLYGEAKFSCSVEDCKEFGGKGHKGAEESANITVSWTTDSYSCELGFVMYYCRTVHGGVIVSDTAFDLQSMFDNEHPLGMRKMMELSIMKDPVISDYQTVVIMRKNKTRIV